MTDTYHKEIPTRKDMFSARTAWVGILLAAGVIAGVNENNAPKDSDLIHLEASGDPRLQNISTGCQIVVINAAQTGNGMMVQDLKSPAVLQISAPRNAGTDFNNAALYQQVGVCVEARVAAYNAHEIEGNKMPVLNGLALLASLGIGGYGLGGALATRRREEEEKDQPTLFPS